MYKHSIPALKWWLLCHGIEMSSSVCLKGNHCISIIYIPMCVDVDAIIIVTITYTLLFNQINSFRMLLGRNIATYILTVTESEYPDGN